MKTRQQIHDYYQNIAAAYDETRFGNSYGTFVHRQEDVFLGKWLGKSHGERVLNMGCGTGRFMEYATDGLDFSENMLEIARQKYPSLQFHLGDAISTDFDDETFDAIFCLHLLMHQSKSASSQIFGECHRVLKPGGLLVVDFPSSRRRALLGRSQPNWHGANAFEMSEVLGLLQGGFELTDSVGILFFPIHRLPQLLRKLIYPIDKALCRSVFLEYSSYLMLALRRG